MTSTWSFIWKANLGRNFSLGACLLAHMTLEFIDILIWQTVHFIDVPMSQFVYQMSQFESIPSVMTWGYRSQPTSPHLAPWQMLCRMPQDAAGCRRMPLWFLWFFTIPMRAHLEHQSASTCYRIYRIYRWHWAPRHEDTLSLHALATPPRPSGSTQLRTGHRSPNQTAKRCETAKSLGHLPLPGSGQTFRKEIDRLGCSGTGFDTSGL